MIDDAKRFYRESNLGKTHANPQGCSAAQIRLLESELKLGLPLAYREFLEWMGQDKGGCLRGSDVFISDIVENTKYLPDLLEENSVPRPSLTSVVCFYCHQGYQAAWFEAGRSDDPEVFYYDENNDSGIERRGTFSSFLLSLLKACSKWRSASASNGTG